MSTLAWVTVLSAAFTAGFFGAVAGMTIASSRRTGRRSTEAQALHVRRMAEIDAYFEGLNARLGLEKEPA